MVQITIPKAMIWTVRPLNVPLFILKTNSERESVRNANTIHVRAPWNTNKMISSPPGVGVDDMLDEYTRKPSAIEKMEKKLEQHQEQI